MEIAICLLIWNIGPSDIVWICYVELIYMIYIVGSSLKGLISFLIIVYVC